MIRPLKLLVLMAVLGVVGVSCASAQVQQAPDGVDLTGTWILDTEAGDAAPDSVGPTMRPGGRQPRGGMRPPGDGRAGGMRPGGGFDPDRMQRVREAMDILMPQPERLVILRADTIVEIAWQGRPTASLLVNGKGHEVEWSGTKVELSAEWDRAALLVERKAEGVTVVERYSRNPGTDRLLVETSMDAGLRMAGDRTFRSVYDLER